MAVPVVMGVAIMSVAIVAACVRGLDGVGRLGFAVGTGGLPAAKEVDGRAQP